MSAKNSLGKEAGVAGKLESLYFDLTPKRRTNPEVSEGLDNLSPFPFPPKFCYLMGSAQGSVNHDLKIIETPVHKTTPKLIHNSEDIDQISKKIIWEPNSDEMSRSQSSKDNGMEDDEEEDEQDEEGEGQDVPCNNGQSDNQMEPEQSLQEEQSLHLKEMQYQNHQHDEQKLKKSFNKYRAGQGSQLQKETFVSSSKKVFCNCKKTKCLKLYCDCFRLNQTCEGCNCVGCHNLQIYNDQRNNAIMVLMDRNPDPFGQKIEADKHVKGCNCKKSNCLKKYCQCYQAGLKCSQNCKCQECKNNEDKDPHDKPKGLTAKKEKRMVEM